MYRFLLCTYTSTVFGLTLILTLALSLLYLNTYTSTVTDSSFTLSLKLTQKVFFPLESAHYARVVQELYGLYVLMMVYIYIYI